MDVTLTIQVGYESHEDLIAWLEAGVEGQPVAKKRKTRARKPMTAAEKKAFREGMVKGQEEAAKWRQVEQRSNSAKSAAAKKPAKQ